MEYAEPWPIAQAWIIANSGWIIALLSAVAGSVAGSWWTQRVIEEREHIAAGRAELRAINRAIMVCFAVVNAYMSLKKQHLVKLIADYRKCQEDTKAALARDARVISFSADMTSIPHPQSLATRLEDLLFNEISAGGRALAAATALVDIQQHLNRALDTRDALIQEFRASSLDGRQFAEVFFALTDANGNVDARYQDCIRAIEVYTNDCIFFAMVSAHDLRQYGERLIRRYSGSIGSIGKNLHNVDWSSTEHQELQPKSADYASWTRGFIETPKWWQLWKKPTPMSLPF